MIIDNDTKKQANRLFDSLDEVEYASQLSNFLSALNEFCDLGF